MEESSATPPPSGFSIASVLMSFLMVAGGIAAAATMVVELRLQGSSSAAALAGIFGAGAFVGGWLAARASRGQTVAEPAIGAVLVVATVCALLLATPVGRLLYSLAEERLTRLALISAGAALGGGLVGAFLSEKILGHSTTRGLPWIIYVALAVAGGCFLAALGAGALRSGSVDPSTLAGRMEGDRQLQVMVMAGIAGGCLLAGLAAGASSRRRVLAASFLGALAGVFAFFVLAGRFSRSELGSQALVGAAMIAVGGGFITLVSTAIGWVAVGRRNAG